MHKMNDGVIR